MSNWYAKRSFSFTDLDLMRLTCVQALRIGGGESRRILVDGAQVGRQVRFASLMHKDTVLSPLVSAYLVSAIVAALHPESTDQRVPLGETLFAKVGVFHNVALKVKGSATNSRPAISRSARDAREGLKDMAADGEES